MSTKSILSVLITTTMLAITAVAIIYSFNIYLPR